MVLPPNPLLVVLPPNPLLVVLPPLLVLLVVLPTPLLVLLVVLPPKPLLVVLPPLLAVEPLLIDPLVDPPLDALAPRLFPDAAVHFGFDVVVCPSSSSSHATTTEASNVAKRKTIPASHRSRMLIS